MLRPLAQLPEASGTTSAMHAVPKGVKDRRAWQQQMTRMAAAAQSAMNVQCCNIVLCCTKLYICGDSRLYNAHSIPSGLAVSSAADISSSSVYDSARMGLPFTSLGLAGGVLAAGGGMLL